MRYLDLTKKRRALTRPPFGKLNEGCALDSSGGLEEALLTSGFVAFVLRLGDVTPAELVALGCGTVLAAFAQGGVFESAATADFFENALGIELRFETLECAIY